MPNNSTYHERELLIALDPSHPAHILPPPRPLRDKILDVGCGAGQTIAASYPKHRTWGIDPDIDAVLQGKVIAPNAQLCCGRAEKLPWKRDSFDMAIARVSLPYTNIPVALSEMYRVLKPGGEIWITLHTFSQVWAHAKHADWKGRVFFLYIMVNSIFFHFTGKQFPFLGAYESFQTVKGIHRVLESAGFKVSAIKRGSHFLVEARKENL